MLIDTGFVFFGITASEAESDDALAIPYPTEGSLVFASAMNALTEINANGVSIGHQIGEMRYTQELGWGLIPAEQWWAMRTLVRDSGGVFFCRFFNHEIGEWQTKQVWDQNDAECTPGTLGDNGAPEYYLDASFSITTSGD